jgi:uncharacterized cysteine cluster protein YcgN (CxxCxxCC family)
MTREKPFWKTKTLWEMSAEEWESLCDGCGRCCLVKLEDEDSGRYYFTDIACHLFDSGTCRCGDYENRTALVHDCVKLSPDNAGELGWLPRTCAYRMLSEGKSLAWWHPLVSGTPDTVIEAGISMRAKTVSEREIPDSELENHIRPLPKAKKRGEK